MTETELDSPTPPDVGLSAEEARQRFQRFGPNELAEKDVPVWRRLLQFFWGPIPWMIEAAAILSLILGDLADFSIILVMLIANAGVGFWQAFKADNAIKALKQRLAPSARVLRD
ncbi:MAG: cation-transporting P-type ATPase [Asticcacaulis sp.]|uniref:cation-transporting P-type ATPase n=1 Tax=Asticcacaulis sp. TaxID=1872648 RepID=UPI003F7C8FA6